MFDLARGYADRRHDRLRAAAGGGVRRRGATATPPSSTSARSAPATSTWSARRSTRPPRPPPCAAPPKRSSSHEVRDHRCRWPTGARRDPHRRGAGVPGRAGQRVRRAGGWPCWTPAGPRRAPLRHRAAPDFLPETAAIRADPDWRVAPPAPGLVDRRVEITGPTDRKMTVNALNSGAKVWLADFEDATSPTWHNVIGGQLNLIDALDRRIDFTDPRGKQYALGDGARHHRRPAARLAPGGEAHRWSTAGRSRPAWSTSGSTCSTAPGGSSTRGAGPYFYLPKLESHREARLWNDVFVFAQQRLGLPRGHHPGHRPDRDDHRPPSRWRRSSTSCASTPPG